MSSSSHADLYETEKLPLELDVFLHQVQYPNEFTQEVWEMSIVEKCNEVPITKNKADTFFAKCDYMEAQKHYRRCLIILENLKMLRATTDETWNDSSLSYEELKRQLLNCQLNDALCSLKLENYSKTISQCNEILKQYPNQPKALYRRAVSFIKIGRDLEEAEADLKTLLELEFMKKDEIMFKNIWTELQTRWVSVTEKEKKMFKNVLPAY
ncbi:hypothetical protein HMI56_002471 [Coelomomyces lativittatus]|nr:hypothetical protein HMI56_002471 [Coelomomyces lativittatus]